MIIGIAAPELEVSVETVDVASNSTISELLRNPHVLWQQLVGLVLSLGILGYLARGFAGSALALLIGGLTFADAWRSGIYKDPSQKHVLNMSPMGWGIAMPVLFIAIYPLYVFHRNKLRTRNNGNGFFIATIIIGAVMLVLAIVAFISRGAVG